MDELKKMIIERIKQVEWAAKCALEFVDDPYIGQIQRGQYNAMMGEAGEKKALEKILNKLDEVMADGKNNINS